MGHTDGAVRYANAHRSRGVSWAPIGAYARTNEQTDGRTFARRFVTRMAPARHDIRSLALG
ncbi:hypothetical protein X777_16459 [Ooceraea biroi]|uniref:Uncharacterized protein n=1 Tax=Ooceraea biroi TaxID=2015173 RepID=A0A026VTZ1_OOCBI|nr:hypothetical protein X777_16459 [Ooceraea biroi]